MSARSELVFRASGMISNPLLLCALVSKRVRQLTIGGSGNRSTAEIVDYALGELLGGLLQFQIPAEKDGKSQSKSPSNPLMEAARVLSGMEATSEEARR
jgi:hypothetical protein